MARHGYPELEPDQRGVPDNSEEQPDVPQRRSMPTSLNVSHKQGRPIGTLLVSSAVVVWLGVLLFTTEPFPSTDPNEEPSIARPGSPTGPIDKASAGNSSAGLGEASSPDRPQRQSGLIPMEQRETAPNFSLPDLEGDNAELQDYTDQVLLLNFWATWCLPCRAEMPWFVDFQETWGEEGFQVLGVSLDEPGWSTVRPFLQSQPVNYRIALADTTESQSQFGIINILPTTWLIDRDGRIAAKHIGLVRQEEIAAEIDELLDEQIPRTTSSSLGVRTYNVSSATLQRKLTQ
ncbi:MAG: hypothetical protein CL484_00935 [Acidobacteria bacterium]|nr:hypothetical protein [Acidobacteriota bacterium]